MKQNRFGAFAEEDTVAAEVKQVQAAAKAAEPKKKITVKVAKAPVQEAEGAEEFEKVQNRTQTGFRGAERGGRGGRGGDRRGGRGGDRGGRGGRPEGAQGERREGGERPAGRGRGQRPKTADTTSPAVEGEEGPVTQADRPERAERRGGERRGRGERGPNRFEGKAREDAHPLDRQDGTGRGRRGDKKGGHGKGNWGKPVEGETPVVEEGKEATNGEAKPEKERRERKPREEQPKPEPVVEEEVGFTLDDYIAAQKAKSQGLLKKAEVRGKEKIDTKNIKESDIVHTEQQVTIQKNLPVGQTYATVRGSGAELFGFQNTKDEGEEYEARGKGGRGGRGGDRPRNDRPQTQRGGRKGGKIIVDDNEFPAL